ncbi:MAG: GlsB/YeaQ/YmgE family stress response membrane protein [Nitrospira sp.]|nr:GlsB/YeaQ/YmgE family stress response membrane protein [Nitrospira sp.]
MAVHPMGSIVLSILGWMMIGLIVGVVPKLLTRRRDRGGTIVTTTLGIAGSLTSGCIGVFLGWYRDEDLISSLAAVIGAMTALFVYRQTVASRYANPGERRGYSLHKYIRPTS